ncbi:hypothetical protein CEUSTIGMA_g4590.t1 [Chlamydomonas eustigma]|uniref:Natural resistance-associated macrophage protein n=1 Tax=Chlamydomonas eustigma TaxID=1157962 RepID=A0A250X219_9CHLO|nr:hypothetical protein CEUSTIGMA_g4590.t1 [Chlamydomonas eustigma]|eukprot:GAX77144.1 hypothetical protein CEUSTIGMA_g4590.t1 [Chlamydomonas eustigma]
MAIDRECLEMSPRLPSSQRKIANADSSKQILCAEVVGSNQEIASCSKSGHNSSWISKLYDALRSSFGFKSQAAYERVVDGCALGDEAVTFSTLQFLRFCGSGLLMSVSYLDPGNLEADIQVGAQAGYSLLWWYGISSVFFGFAFQCQAGRLGLVTGQDLAQHCGKRYPKEARILLWTLLEFAIVGADIQETIGSAIAISILTGGAVPLWLGCILISVTAFFLLLLDRFGFRQLEIVFAALIAVEAVALGINYFEADIPLQEVTMGLIVPKISSATLPVAVGALGALVMPYNIYFQSSIVNSRPRDSDSDEKMGMLLVYMRMENMIMLVFAFIINVFVVCVFAEGFYNPDNPSMELGLESAGDHLAERYGNTFRIFWAIGLLAAGQVATISLTYAGQLVMTGLLGMKVQAGVRMVATRLVALIPTVVMAVLFEATNTFDVAAQMLNVAQSLLLPFALLPALHMTANKEIMGEKFVSAKWFTILTAGITAIVLAVNGYLLYDVMRQQHASGGDLGGSLAVLLALMLIIYYSLTAYYAIGPDNIPGLWRFLRGKVVTLSNPQDGPQETDPMLASIAHQHPHDR